MKKIIAITLMAAAIAPVLAADIEVPMNRVNAQGTGESIGHVTLSDSPFGVVITPHLTGLPPGVHGFHLHTNPSCAPASKDGKAMAAMAAGGHWDPEKTGEHGMPWDSHAHQGDLPPLFVLSDGSVDQPVLAPRLKSIADLRHHALVIHAGGDNHSDKPAPLGGGGARLACGVID